MKINNTHKKSEKNLQDYRGNTYRISCTRVVNKPRMPNNDLILNFMKFNENFINRNEKVEKLNR